MKEASSFEGASLVPATPPIGKAPGAASAYVVAEAPAVSLDKPLEWAVGFFFGNVELSLELWTVIAGIEGSTIECNCSKVPPSC